MLLTFLLINQNHITEDYMNGSYVTRINYMKNI